jgi:hypothetical protein
VGTEADAPTWRDEQEASLLAELAAVAEELAKVPGLYQRRVELFDKMRSLDPPVPFETISATDGASPEACRVALLKKRRADSGNPITRKKKNAPA